MKIIKISNNKQIQINQQKFNEQLCDSEEQFFLINQHPDCKYVAGYLENEIQIITANDRDSYTNWEVNEYLDSYFRFFGQKDMDTVYLYFISKKKQEEIMTILGKSQPAVSYDVSKIREQIDFIVKIISSVDDFIMFITDPENKMKTSDKEMLTLFFYTTSIAKTARLMGINNISCRSHLNTIVNKLLSRGYNDMYNLFKYIMNNLNYVKKYVARNDEQQEID